ncbi:MAG: hypothetical protein ACTSW4_03100 [Candidatus Ranarchaeia archaeon]
MEKRLILNITTIVFVFSFILHFAPINELGVSTQQIPIEERVMTKVQLKFEFFTSLGSDIIENWWDEGQLGDPLVIYIENQIGFFIVPVVYNTAIRGFFEVAVSDEEIEIFAIATHLDLGALIEISSDEAIKMASDYIKINNIVAELSTPHLTYGRYPSLLGD